jgi:hypothetical protein
MARLDAARKSYESDMVVLGERRLNGLEGSGAVSVSHSMPSAHHI